MSYRFEGRTVKLNESDYNRWKKIYHAIPDFDAELQRIDDSDLPEKWFCAVSAKLAVKHQNWLSKKKVELPKSGPSKDDNVSRIKKAFAENKRWLAPKNLTDIRIVYGLGLISREEAEFCGYRP